MRSSSMWGTRSSTNGGVRKKKRRMSGSEGRQLWRQVAHYSQATVDLTEEDVEEEVKQKEQLEDDCQEVELKSQDGERNKLKAKVQRSTRQEKRAKTKKVQKLRKDARGEDEARGE